MEIAIAAFLFAERNMEVNHFIEEQREKLKEPRLWVRLRSSSALRLTV